MSSTNIEKFRDGIFALRTRRFGSVAEIMIKKLFKLGESKYLSYDKYDKKKNKKIEVKFSTVMKENSSKIIDDNVIEQCLDANLAVRTIKSNETANHKFDCNIQQIKCSEFDVLYYGLFFYDKIEIFKIGSNQVRLHKGYSNKQHRGNTGEGQFHINQDNIEYHRKKYLIKTLTYNQLYQIFKQ